MQTAATLPSFNEQLFYTSYLDHYRSPLDLRSQSNLSGSSLSDISALYPATVSSYGSCGQSGTRTHSFSSISAVSTMDGIESVTGTDVSFSEVTLGEGGVAEETLFDPGMTFQVAGSAPEHSHVHYASSSMAGSSSMLLASGQVMMASVKQEKFAPSERFGTASLHHSRYPDGEYSEEIASAAGACADVVSRAKKVLQQRRATERSVGRFSPSSSSSSPPSSPCSPTCMDDSDAERYQLATSNPQGKQITNKVGGHTFMDITPYMTLPQAEAARRLGIPPSTLSKRWRVAARKRKWPWRVVSKLDKEITTLMYNITPGETLDKEVEERLAYLMARRQKELRPVSIRI